MKRLAWGLGALILTGCAAPTATPAPVPTPAVVSPVPTPTPTPAPEMVSPTPPPRPTPAPAEDIFPRRFLFSSGAGAWCTDLSVEADGTFSGSYLDADLGSGGEGYLGTEYRCDFTGAFSQPERVDDYIYSMKLESIEWERTAGEVDYEDEIRVIYSEPYGLKHADEVLIYLPGADLSQLPEEFTQWTRNGREGVLSFYGLYNVEDGQGFQEYQSKS